MASNYSFYSIPLYWFISLCPHWYAVNLIKTSNNGYWNLANPKAAKTEEGYQKAVPAEIYDKYERSQAAHRNMIENAPLFIGAVVVGNVAGLPTATLNQAVGAYIGLRVLYATLYINVRSQKYAPIRSLIWLSSVALLFGVYIKAGNKIR
ncbi:hypothetical protein K491DRAFT_713527 [Lophiostoma macrostomum CBS 122681]|uniref:Membrane-associated proteins in eicosanoid and glutathione metabolism n=1 Tax=Lophiostoma macrostomum CBS 122681 TaxID=1314788 RepID=A0A6A6TFC1_9PLEO|nr:hypothetical protein K491DRAFT_713527 [Lophiostoma macrostomum CBS 122681]